VNKAGDSTHIKNPRNPFLTFFHPNSKKPQNPSKNAPNKWKIYFIFSKNRQKHAEASRANKCNHLTESALQLYLCIFTRKNTPLKAKKPNKNTVFHSLSPAPSHATFPA
jgi:hypothetical protein